METEANSITEKVESVAEEVSKILNDEIKRNGKDTKHLYFLVLSLEYKDMEQLYKKIFSNLQKYCQTFAAELKRSSSEKVFETYVKLWVKYLSKGKVIDVILMQLNNKYVTPTIRSSKQILPIDFLGDEEKVYTIRNLMHKNWSDEVIAITKDELLNTLFDQIHMQRSGVQSLHIENAKAVIDSFIESQKYLENNELELYTSAFEQPLIEQITNYYGNLAKHLVETSTSEDYAKLCHSVLEKENEIAVKVYSLSEKVVYEATWKCMVLDHIEKIMDATKICMKLNKHDNTLIPYRLSKYSPETAKMFYLQFQNREEEVFSEIRKNCDDSIFCETFIKTYQERLTIANCVYESDIGILSALGKGIAQSLNAPLKRDNNENGATRSKASDNRIPELIAKYCDNFLKKGTKGLSDAEMDNNLEGAITIFKYIDDKDIFKEHYAKTLAKRLIHSMSQSMDAEESFIKKLKLNCGAEYVLKLEKMISDFKISRDETLKFKETHGSSLPYSVNIMVLQFGSWPVPTIKTNILVPQDLEAGLRLFNKFYVDIHAGRKLTWNHNLSTCDVKLKYLKKPYVMHTTVTTMALLASFNQNDSGTVSEISQSSGMGSQELVKYLQWLVNQKFLKSADAEITDNSMVSLDDKYENKKLYFKLMPNFRDLEETKQTVESVVNDRRFILKALIVKIMKGSKTISQKDLINEVVRQSMPIFVPSHTFIKSVIQTLIEKEYMKCKEEGSDVYEYIA